MKKLRRGTYSIARFPNGKWRENGYVIYNQKRNAIIIDPGGEAQRLIKYIDRAKLMVVGILMTHGHYDHVGAVEMLKRHYSVDCYLHSSDEKLLKRANIYKMLFERGDLIPIPVVDQYLDKMSSPFQISDFLIQWMLTPGHTVGGVCFQIGNNLFTGDVLLKNKIGHSKLPDGDSVALRKSLQRLSGFPPKTKIYPGHGYPSTIGMELTNNKAFLEIIR